MSRPTLEVADLIHAQGDRFVERYRSWLSFQQLSVLGAIGRCRTAALGGHVDTCPRCDQQAISYNSCRNRHCPKCQAQARQRWLAAREQEVLGVPYFHVVFTLPHALQTLCEQNPALLYGLLFWASARTLLEVAANAKHLGAQIGFLSILHTWGQNLLLHPHVHCVIPAGGLSSDHTRWVRPKYAFFLPVKVLSRVFRGKFVDGLRRAHRHKKLRFGGPLTTLKDPKNFASFLRTLCRQDWVVYAKPAFGGPAQVLRYLGRYTHRVAISNHRLLAFDGQRVTFRWKDYAHGNRQRKITFTATEFLRRFVQHVLPRGFIRIRQFGFLANRCRKALLALARRLLASALEPPPPCSPAPANTLTWRCPRCASPMRIGPQLTPAQLAFRCSYFDSS
ncbi:MAG: IS91 family transposase [Terriglobia bacterium]